ncbi:hypothetical protein NC239_20890 [Streptomyces sp. G3]|nr:hypothetical protein [Streptomyces sp. G3]MCM1940662.1 hypothetical protein [Streptomyces sp. G3]
MPLLPEPKRRTGDRPDGRGGEPGARLLGSITRRGGLPTRGDEVSTADPGDAALRRFLADPAHLTLDLRTATARAATALGLRHAVVYLVDIQQRRLVPQTAVAPTLPV